MEASLKNKRNDNNNNNNNDDDDDLQLQQYEWVSQYGEQKNPERNRMNLYIFFLLHIA